MKGDQAGFTLIELMVAVVVIGILAAVAYPSYQEQVRRSHRAAAKATMLQIAHREERYFTENNKYDTLPTLGYAAATINAEGNAHSVTIAAGNTGQLGTSYIITATPVTTDATCGNLTLTNTGVWGNSVGAPVKNC